MVIKERTFTVFSTNSQVQLGNSVICLKKVLFLLSNKDSVQFLPKDHLAFNYSIHIH